MRSNRAGLVEFTDEDSDAHSHVAPEKLNSRPKRTSAAYKRPIVELSSDEESLNGFGNHDLAISSKINGGNTKSNGNSGSRFVIDKVEDEDDVIDNKANGRGSSQEIRNGNKKTQGKKTPLRTGTLSSYFKPLIPKTQSTTSVSTISNTKNRKRKQRQSDDDFNASSDEEVFSPSSASSPVLSPSVSIPSEDENTVVQPKPKRPKLANQKKPSSHRKFLHNGTISLVRGSTGAASKWNSETANKLPPISSIPDMFRDIVQRTPELVDVAKHMNGKPLRVATMCSGTESPLLALGMISDFMKKEYNITLNIEHIFSCEIEPFKQAYIERNFKPPILFRDVCELGNKEATTAYGAKVPVPGNCDMLVAGTSCVDFSNLNNRQKALTDEGESGQTFRGMLSWVDNHRPKIVILENVCNAPWIKIAEFFEKRGYSAVHGRFDTKNYYVPHTRTRGYLIAVDEKDSDRPTEWLQLIAAMRRPASVTLEDFLLDPDDPRVHEARQKLIRDEVVADKRNEWTACENRHARERFNLQVGRGRPLTKWQEEGKCTLPDFAWSDWGNSQVDRVCDLLDITYLKNAKKGVDVCFKTQMWNVSQNVDRNIEGSKAGICTCLTPTAIPYLTQRGGPMIGLEALFMQGLPVDQLLLTRETEKNLLDLAGNAMSSTVVGTAMIAALIVSKDILEGNLGDSMDITVNSDDKVHPIVGEEFLEEHNLDLGTVKTIPIKYLVDQSDRSSRKCYCEGRTGLTENKVQKCQDCGSVTCEKCGKSPVHNYALDTKDRLHPMDFEKELKSSLPMILRINGVDANVLDDLVVKNNVAVPESVWKLWQIMATNAFASHFRFSSLKRQQAWTVFYVAADARLELHLDPIQPEWRMYAVVPSTEPGDSLKRKLSNEPVARARFNSEMANLLDCEWAICLPADTKAVLNIRGMGDLINSWEKNLGLLNAEAVSKMVWSKLSIEYMDAINKDIFDRDLTGTYTLLPDCGTATRALHKKDGDEKPRLFLFLDPTTTGDVKDDGFVFSVSPRRYLHREKRPIVGKLDPKWRPSSSTEANLATCTFNGTWRTMSSVKFAASLESASSTTFAFADSTSLTNNNHNSCRDATAFLLCKAQIDKDALAIWPRQWTEVDQIHAQETFTSLAWLTEKIKSKNNMEGWTTLEIPEIEEGCQVCSPSPPDLQWRMKGKNFVPIEDPEQAGPYENALKNRPLPWVNMFCLDGSNKLNLKIGLNLTTLAHRAASLLPHQQHLGKLTIKWRMVADYVLPPRIVFPPYTIKSNKNDRQHSQPPHFLKNLRPEQLRSLTWMLRQESKDSEPFMEEEIAEAYHEHMNWRVDVKAERPNFSRGGVLADEVGYGKTAITLGLIDCTQDQYESSTNTEGRIPLKATLVVVPPQLPLQWAKEIAKFTGTTYKVLLIRSLTDLNALSISEMQTADIIIVSCTIFKSANYLENLAGFAGSPNCPTTEGRRYKHWLDVTLRRLVNQTQTLQIVGAQAVLDTIRASEMESLSLVQKTITPSKRLKGAALSKATNAAKSGVKSKREIESDTDEMDDYESDVKTKTKAGPRKSRVTADPWLLKTKATKEWRWMRSPPLDMFYFNRIVIDEFTYLKGNIHMGITSLKSKYKWVLSGTPPLGDFTDIKSISVFLGIHLGNDDDTVGSKINNRKIASQKSAVELFQSFHQKRTAAWHLNRYSVAQSFLNKFMRQNVAEIDEIPFEEHIIAVNLPAAERAIYLELEHHLMALDMMITRRGKAKTDSDRDKRLSESIGNSATAEEALLKKCSHFALDESLIDVNGNAPKACDVIVQERGKQLKSNRADLYDRLVEALLLYREAQHKNPSPDEDLPFKEFLNRQKRTVHDPDGSEIVHNLIKKAEDNIAKEPKRKLKIETIIKKSKHDSASEESDHDGKMPDEDQAAMNIFFELKNRQSQLVRLIKELMGRVRSLRYFKVVRDMQQNRLVKAIDFDKSVLKGVECAGCGRKELLVSEVAVSSGCGHLGCFQCLVEKAYNDDACPMRSKGCEYAARSSNIVKVNSLGVEEDEDKKGKHYGVKLEKVINLIQHKIPHSEKIIVFVQFQDLMDKVSEAFEENKIDHIQIRGSSARKSKNLQDFQEGIDEKGPRVLLLNVADESASGANLTNANHVIFISPLLTESLQTYKANETQAIGRVRRYGQVKKIHIYRFLTTDSIDVKLYEERMGRKLDLSQIE